MSPAYSIMDQLKLVQEQSRTEVPASADFQWLIESCKQTIVKLEADNAAYIAAIEELIESAS